MQPKELAELLGVTSNTIRRWCDEFHKYLTPTASPPKGKQRVLGDHDARVMQFIAVARDQGQPIETIKARLDAMQADDWQGLSETPPEWSMQQETMPVALAASRAYDVAQVAVLQRELEHAQQALETAQNRVQDLEQEIASLRASGEATQGELTAARLELEKRAGEVSTLQAKLSGYALTGSQPLPLAAIILVTALAVAALVIVLLVVVRLVV